jgi:hypothetical protein
MIKYFIEGIKIRKIARRLPIALVYSFGEKEFYSRAEVVQLHSEKVRSETSQAYAFAMFCSPTEFDLLRNTQNISENYSDLRNKIGKHCFDGWPRSNFKTLLDYAKGRYFFIGGDGGC